MFRGFEAAFDCFFHFGDSRALELMRFKDSDQDNCIEERC